MTLASGRGALLLVASVASLAPQARAEASRWTPGEQVASTVRGEVTPHEKFKKGHDGVYGRFEGDLTLSIGLGAELQDGPRGTLVGRALYYHSAGLTLIYADGLGSHASPKRVGTAAVELRPLFLPRWAMDLQWGRPFLDLTLDSLALGAGVFVAGRAEPLRTQTGLELSLSLGIPLFANAEGLWLEGRGFLRPGLDEGNAGLSFALSLYESLITPLINKLG